MPTLAPACSALSLPFADRAARRASAAQRGSPLSSLLTSTSPLSLLAEFGPDAPPPEHPPAPADCLAYCRRLARSHNENFPVLTRLLDPALVDPFAAVYAYCRWADDLADEAHPIRGREHAESSPDTTTTHLAESAPATHSGSDSTRSSTRLGLLSWWRSLAKSWHLGEPPTHPVFIALAEVHKSRAVALPLRPFLDHIDAFDQDQRVTRYDTWEQLLHYCARSANPVGRLVLALGGVEDAGAPADHEVPTARRHVLEQSDALCTALQLTNFWQDVRRDLTDRDRIYLPRELTGLDEATLRDFMKRGDDPRARVPYILSVRPLVRRTAELFEQSADLHRFVPASIATPVRLFHAGGVATLRRIEAIGCATLWKRPALSRSAKSMLVARAFVQARFAGKGGRGR